MVNIKTIKKLLKYILARVKKSRPHPPSRFRGVTRRKITSCPTCQSSNNSQELFSVWEGKDKVRTKICGQCGTVYLTETLESSGLEMMGKHGGSLVYGKKNSEEVIQAAIDLMYNRAEKYFGFILKHRDLKGKSHLDVTCQYGGVVKYFSEKGLESYGIDASEDLIESGCARGFKLILGDFLEHQFEQKFDVITLPRVINHYINPIDYLIKAKSLLKPGGVIFIEQLNFTHAIRRKGIYRAISLDHPVMYTEKTLKSSLALAGLGIIEESTDIEPRHDFLSLNHMHMLCEVQEDIDVVFEPISCLNDVLIAANQYSLTNDYNVYK